MSMDIEDYYKVEAMRRNRGNETLGKLHIKNYNEYLKKLRENFNGTQQMPSDDEVHSFISKYNLDSNWKINIFDVRQDILFQILSPEAIIDRKKRISSYKEYLIKLKAVFGIPEIMPKDSEIEVFISEFGLKKNWGITVKDVSEDLEKFINGKYDELYKDASHRKKPSVHKSIQQLNVHVLPARKPTSVSRTGYYHTSKTINQKFNGKRKESNLQKIIFIDGDNHFDEGQKGIEHTTEDIKVRAIFSQPGAKKRFDKKYGHKSNVSSKLVSPGNQAVDNQIKAEAGQLLKNGNQDITFVSHDTDFAKYKDRKKNNKLGNIISTAKSVEEKLKKNKKKK